MHMIRAALFDFGGVLAEEGFREGIGLIALLNGRDPKALFSTAEALIYRTGYVTGTCDESVYWNAFRNETGIKWSDGELRREVLSQFVLREEMLQLAGILRASGLLTAILSDQTNWLEEINSRRPFYIYFDLVFNSFRTKKSKRDPSVFRDICAALGVSPGEAVFVDDNMTNIRRAAGAGLHAIHFLDVAGLKGDLRELIPGLSGLD